MIRSDCLHLIQYRNPVGSIASDYYLHLNNHPTHTDTVHWEKFALEQIQYWNRFVDKWLILSKQWAGTLTCPYELLVGNPVDTVTKVISFMSGAPLSLCTRDRALERINFRPKGKLEQFEHYDELFFDELERITSRRIVILGIPTYKLSV